MKPFSALLCSMAVFTVAAPIEAVAAQGGLSNPQLQELRALPFTVAVPQPAPAGFTVQSVSVNRKAQTYDIRYRGPHGATMDISGRGGGGTQSTAGAPAHHGLFQNIGNAINHLTSHAGNSASFHGANNEANANANDQSGKAGEEQEEMTGVGAYNSTYGPVNFQQSGSCLNGTNDPSHAQIHNASFTVSGCHMNAPDAVIRAYKSLAPIH